MMFRVNISVRKCVYFRNAVETTVVLNFANCLDKM